MLGLKDPWIWSVYLLCILSALFCIVYGAINWNKGEDKIYPEDVKWVKDEEAVDDEM